MDAQAAGDPGPPSSGKATREAAGPGAGEATALPDVLAGHVCFLVGKLAERAVELFARELTDWRLSVRAAGILLLLHAQGPTSQHRIGRQLHLERSTLSLAIDELERDQLVSRRPDPVNRRYNQLQLTQQGRDAVAAVNAASERSTDLLLHGMPPEQRQQLLDLLRRQL